MRLPFSAALLVLALGPSFPLTAQMSPFSEREPRYRLQPSDVLEVHYRYSPEFDQTVTVQPDGFVGLQLIGSLKLQGLTVEQARQSILDKSAVRLRDPEIVVTLKEFEKPYVVVSGEVTNPGKFEIRGPMNPLQAIALAGGFKTLSAKHSQVILFRRVGPDLARTEILNLQKATSKKSTEPLADLKPGDMLFVPQNTVSKIERLVKLSNIGAFIPIPL